TRLVDIWRETLDIAQVGMNDNFFDLGGHSLLLPVVRERIRVDFGRDIAMLELFRRPTPRALADLLVNGSGESSAVAKDGTHRDARERALRQRRLRMRRES
ncbi:phosphopantetheine-binding protein, partial [Planotetraspora sp. A-T 1434]|uniref:phosphopantetheine-binding protein n=1 Tax=Planotetraspora sp. A-T 1434 TaxID=2979219 RepID=UPI0021BEAF38